MDRFQKDLEIIADTELENQDSRTRLIGRATNEFNRFICEMNKKSAKEIIDAAHEITVKEDILSFIEQREFSKQTLDILITMKNPLECIYAEWLSNGLSIMDLLEETINEVTNHRKEQFIFEELDFFADDSKKIVDSYRLRYGNSEEFEM